MLSILNIQNLRAGASACNACGAGYYSGSTGMCYKYIFLQLVCSTCRTVLTLNLTLASGSVEAYALPEIYPS